jgi:hypothetical protein
MKARIFEVENEPDINLNIKTALQEENSFEVDASDGWIFKVSCLWIYCGFGISIQVERIKINSTYIC